MDVKTYPEPSSKSCCISTLENCITCSEKNHCFILREQLVFYNRLGISQIKDNIDTNSLAKIKHLWQDSKRAKRYDPSWNYNDDPTNCWKAS